MAWLTTLPTPVTVSKDVTVQPVFSGKASVWLDPTQQTTGVVDRYVTILCKITTEVVEYRGLTEEAATASSATSDAGNTTQLYYWYENIGTSGRYYVTVENGSGTEITYSARRANEAGGWTLTKTTVTREIIPLTSAPSS